MSLIDYLINSLLGICVVFFALALLIIIITIMTKMNITDEPKKKKGAEAAEAGAAVASAAQEDRPLAPGSAGDLKLYNTDPRDAAMIMAIVADELQKPINELRFISIREITPEEG